MNWFVWSSTPLFIDPYYEPYVLQYHKVIEISDICCIPRSNYCQMKYNLITNGSSGGATFASPKAVRKYIVVDILTICEGSSSCQLLF